MRKFSISIIVVMVLVLLMIALTSCKGKAEQPATEIVEETLPERIYVTGEECPAGGIVFFDKGESSDGWRYLSAAPAGMEFTARNWTSPIEVPDGGGEAGWRLPDINELNLIYQNLKTKGIGDFRNGIYLSSTTSDFSLGAFRASQNFGDGEMSFNRYGDRLNVRTIRAFADENAKDKFQTGRLLDTAKDNQRNSMKFEYDTNDRIVKITKYSEGKLEETLELSYSGNQVSKLELKNSQNVRTRWLKSMDGNKISFGGLESEDLNLVMVTDSEGNLIEQEIPVQGHVKKCTYTFQYQGGNLLKKTANIIYEINENDYKQEVFTDYKYDDQKSPFTNCKTPKWVMQWYIHVIETDWKLPWYTMLHHNGKNNMTDFLEYTIPSETGGWHNRFFYKYNSEGFPSQQICTDIREGGIEHLTVVTLMYR